MVEVEQRSRAGWSSAPTDGIIPGLPLLGGGLDGGLLLGGEGGGTAMALSSLFSPTAGRAGG
jgi:hypothetical protein